MATHEHTINDAVAALLRETRRAWRSRDIVRSENTAMLKDSAGRPDILVIETDVSPVAIEAEVLPATSVEQEATSRLGEQLRQTGRTILSSIALKYPTRMATKQGLALSGELQRATDLEMALFTGISPENWSRWPVSGWITGTLADLSLLTQSASVPPEVIEKAADKLVEGVNEAAGLLEEMSPANSGAVQKVAQQLFQEDSEQTRRMATTILANAFVFQETLAGGVGKLAEVKSLEEIRGSDSGLTKSAVLAEWRKILDVNYWPIFDIARRILEVLPPAKCKPLINHLAATADALLQNRLMRSHDLTGAVFQRLIADRKFLAAYYTTPASAALLVGLAIAPDRTPNGGSWANADDVKALRIADFACGTGTLLSTVYQRVGQLHELCGGDSEAIHPDMMANSIIGCDVLPAAAHLTASMISGAHPTVKYSQSSILTVAYGKQPGGGVALGSLDLLDTQRKFGILDITARASEGMGESERDLWLSLPHASFDVVIMNPPFTRATNHEGDRVNVPNPVFAAFASTAEQQRLMGEATKKLTAGTSAHGNAGEASIFLVLADRKLKQGGSLALVMPLTLISGESWANSRALLARSYTNLICVSIAASRDEDTAFSADTGMGECLVVGQKSEKGSDRATFVVLSERPKYTLHGLTVAQQIRALIKKGMVHCLEDGPIGGTPLRFGDDVTGHLIDAPLPQTGGWNVARMADLSLAQAAYQLAVKGRIWLPTQNKSVSVNAPITVLGKIADTGPIDRDINGINPGGSIRGPFDIVPVKENSAPTYPVLWSHEADRERTMSFAGDSEGMPRRGDTTAMRRALAQKVAAVWSTASHCHFNVNFRFNSQSTSMQFTPCPTIGGTAWLSVTLPSVEHEKTIVTWANTTLGLLLRWWHSNKQQSGRGRIGKSMLSNMPVLDVTKLSPSQLGAAVRVFDEMCDKPLKPIHEIDNDPVRHELDERFGKEVLGLPESLLAPDGPLDLVRKKLAREPSIRGGK